MRAHEFVIEKKKKRRSRGAAYGPGPYGGYGYYAGYSSDSDAGDGGGVGENQRSNEKPKGPETKPTMPKGTVKVDVSDVYDWYKLGQHISDLKGLGKHDFSKGPPSTILSFGDEDEEHKYIKNLKKTGLDTTDIDPKSHEKKKGQKTDPTYNVGENFADGKNPGRKGIDELMAATSVPWKWTYRSERQATAEFTVGDVEYEFKAKNSEYDHIDSDRDAVGYDDEDDTEEADYRGYWEISFTGNGKVNMLGTGNAAQVVSAITAIIKDFIKTYSKQIRVIEYDTQGSSGRAGVYGRIFSKLLPNWTQEDGSLHDVEVRRPMSSTSSMQENFADGKKPGRKGLAKRSGVNTKASVSSLRKTAKNSSGEKQRMAHWLANMKAGRAKKNK